jgi:hypothetical protein
VQDGDDDGCTYEFLETALEWLTMATRALAA